MAVRKVNVNGVVHDVEDKEGVEANAQKINDLKSGKEPAGIAHKLVSGLVYRGYINEGTILPSDDNSFYLTNSPGNYIDREGNAVTVATEGVTLIQRKNGEWKTYALWELVSELNNASRTRFASAHAVKKLKDMIDQIAMQGGGGSGGGGSVIVDSELSESSINPVQNAVITAALNELTEDNTEITKKINDNAAKITALSSGLKASLTATPNVVHKDTATQIILNASLKDNAGNVVADNILIKNGDDMIAEGANKSSIIAMYSLNASSDTTFSADVSVKGMTLSAKATVSVRNPVYAGMGTSATSVAVAANKQSARTSAKGYNYTKTATADGQYFFLLVPSDVTKPTAFTMGGAPFAMEAGTTETINEINYTVYRSSSVYNNGAEVTVTAN